MAKPCPIVTGPILRFAPSPNGYLHLGHAYSALFTWARARELMGTVLLRIEDIDTGRCRAEYVSQIFDDLAWLGLKWPHSQENSVRIQSQHFDDYRTASDKLVKMGLLYRCNCTRKQIIAGAKGAMDPDGAARYSGICSHLDRTGPARALEFDTPFALRLDMDKAIEVLRQRGQVELLEQCARFADLSAWSDVVIVRKDTPTSYHLSVVIDDAIQNISHVTRGKDMFEATAIHILLQGLLELPTPHYEHHDLVTADDGRKLAKSLRDRSIKAMREDGVNAEEMIAMLGF